MGLIGSLIQAFMNRGKGPNAPSGGGQEGFGHTVLRGLGSGLGGFGMGMGGFGGMNTGTGGMSGGMNPLISQLIEMFRGRS